MRGGSLEEIILVNLGDKGQIVRCVSWIILAMVSDEYFELYYSIRNRNTARPVEDFQG